MFIIDSFSLILMNNLNSLIGGALIGLSTVLLYGLNGRIAGISGIMHGLLSFRLSDMGWRLFFIAGLLLGSNIYYFFPSIHFVPRTHYPTSLLFISGVLVAIGTKLSGGCTSGHGICGIARLSKRSIVGTLIFFITAVLTVYVIRHILNF